MSESLLEVKGLKKYYPINKGFFNRAQGYVKAVDDISFSVSKVRPLAWLERAAAVNPQPAVPCFG